MGPSAPLENCAAIAPSSQMVCLWAKAGFSKKAAPREFTALTACPRKMTTLIAWQMVLGLGRRAPSRALWFGKALQTSRARGCHHHPLPGRDVHWETRFHFFRTFTDGGGGSRLFGPPGPLPISPRCLAFPWVIDWLCCPGPCVAQPHSSQRCCWQASRGMEPAPGLIRLRKRRRVGSCQSEGERAPTHLDVTVTIQGVHG